MTASTHTKPTTGPFCHACGGTDLTRDTEINRAWVNAQTDDTGTDNWQDLDVVGVYECPCGAVNYLPGRGE